MARLRPDIKGKKFGKLKVLSFAYQGHKSMWNCECACGNQVVVRIDSLSSGNTKSCGCLYMEVSPNRKYTITKGEVYGKWTVVNPHVVVKNEKGKRYYCAEVKCECGEVKTVDRNRLVYGKSETCGCSRRKEIIDRTGQVHGEWTFIKYIGHAKWMVRCSCSNVRIMSPSNIITGISKSCHGQTKHSDSNSPEHLTWRRLIERCYNKNGTHYSYYGGRGIRVTKRWLGDEGYINFLQDMGKQPSFRCALGRINSRLGYSKDNCLWKRWNAGRKKQVKE